jgi:hypothetical protein
MIRVARRPPKGAHRASFQSREYMLERIATQVKWGICYGIKP